MPQTISKIGIKDSSGTGYDTRDIGAKGQNVEVGYDASGKIILDVDAQTPTTKKQLTKVLQDAEKNISDLDNSKAPDNHAWSDADSGVNHGLADGTHYGHIKVGDGLTVNSGKVDVSYGNSANTACEGNDSRLSNARKNPKALTFSDGTTNISYDGSAEKTVNAATIGAAPSGHTSVQATGSILGHVKTGTGITNNSGTISVSYGTTAGTACQGNDSRLSDSRTPKSHAATATTYGSGTSSNYGHVKLTDTYSVDTPNASTNGANTGIAASAYALQQAYNTLNSKFNCTNIEKKEIIVPDEYKNKISFRDGVEKYVFKCGKICIASIMFYLSEDITFPTNDVWNVFLSLPFELCDGSMIYFFQISRIDDNTSIYPLASTPDIRFWSGTTIKSGWYYFHVTYFTN